TERLCVPPCATVVVEARTSALRPVQPCTVPSSKSLVTTVIGASAAFAVLARVTAAIGAATSRVATASRARARICGVLRLRGWDSDGHRYMGALPSHWCSDLGALPSFGT